MAYEDFVIAFAQTQGIPRSPNLADKLAEKYNYIVNTRDVVKPTLAALEEFLPSNLSDFRVLHIGCGYGSLLIELARRGAAAVGVDTSDPKLELARINAKNEADVTFLKSYFTVRSHAEMIKQRGPYDLIIVHDLFRRAYDTARLLRTLKSISAPGALLNYRIINGYATQAVLSDPVKKKVGLTLLPPDKVFDCVGPGYNVYFRERDYYDALFDHFGFKLVRSLVQVSDSSHEHTNKAIERDLSRIRAQLVAENFADSKTFTLVRTICRDYIEEARTDMSTLTWEDVYERYRAAFWEGFRRL